MHLGLQTYICIGNLEKRRICVCVRVISRSFCKVCHRASGLAVFNNPKNLKTVSLMDKEECKQQTRFASPFFGSPLVAPCRSDSGVVSVTMTITKRRHAGHLCLFLSLHLCGHPLSETQTLFPWHVSFL